MFYLNFHLAKRMVKFFNLRLSLWARSILDSYIRIIVIVWLGVIFLIDTVATAMFESDLSGQGAKLSPHLEKASASLLTVTGLLYLAVVLVVQLKAPPPRVDRLTVKTAVFFTGAGVFTMTSQLIRLASTFFIWEPQVIFSTVDISKILYYSTGFGLEILTVALYAITRVDILFGQPPSFTLAPPPKRSASTSKTRAVPEWPLRMNPIVAGDGGDTNSESWSKQNEGRYRRAFTNTRDSIMKKLDVRESVQEVDSMSEKSSDMIITIHRSFSVSSLRRSSLSP